MKNCRKASRTAQIASHSLTIVGMLGISLLIFSYFVSGNPAIYLFSQLMVTLSFALIFFLCWVLLVNKKGRTTGIVLLFIGSAGRLMEYLSDLWAASIVEKPAVSYISGFIIAIACISILNKEFFSKADHDEIQGQGN